VTKAYTVDAVTTVAKGGIEANRESLRPDQDWQPVIVGITVDGAAEVIAFPMPPNEGDNRDVLAAALFALAKQHRFKAMAFVSMVWMVDTQASTEAEAQASQEHLAAGGLPSTDPNRREAIIVQAMDAEVQRLHYAFVTRHPDQPPELGEWQHFDEREGSIEGRFAGLQEALR
jgi:hypothetical protein